MAPAATTPRFDIPTHCKAGVVVNEGPDFKVQVETVPVPEPGTNSSIPMETSLTMLERP